VWALFTQGSTFGINLVVANILGRIVYGEFTILLSTALTLSTIAQLATGITATKYVAESRSVDSTKTGRILGLCAALSIIMAITTSLLLLIGASPLAELVLKAPHLRGGLVIITCAVFFSVLNGYQVGALAGLESYRALARAGIIIGCLSLAFCTLTSYLWDLHGALIGIVIASILRWIIFGRALRQESAKQGISLTYRGAWAERGIILKFSIPAALSGFTTMPAIWIANAFLVRQHGGYDEMALYGAANSFRMLALFIPIMINNVGMSIINHQLGLRNSRHYKKVFWLNLCAVGGAAFVFGTIMAILGPWLLLSFGKTFDAGYPTLLMLMLSTIPEALAMTLFLIIQSRERMWHLFLFNTLPRDTAMVAFAYFLIPVQGALGLAISYSLSRTISCIVNFIIVLHIGLDLRKNNGGNSLNLIIAK